MAEYKNTLTLQTESGQNVSIDLRNALILTSAPTTSTAARAGMQAYVVSGGTITAEYVCTAVSGSMYTWVKLEISGSGGGSGGTVDNTADFDYGAAYSDVAAAVEAGKHVRVRYYDASADETILADLMYIMPTSNGKVYVFGAAWDDGIMGYWCRTGGSWTMANRLFRTSISGTPSNERIPSEKAVSDFVKSRTDTLAEVIGTSSEYLKSVQVYADAEHIKKGGVFTHDQGFVESGAYDSVLDLPVAPADGTAMKVFCTITGSASLVFFDESKNMLGYINGNNCADYGITADLTPKIYEVIPPDDTKYISFTVYPGYGANVSEYMAVYKIQDYSAGLLRRTADLEAVNEPSAIQTMPEESYLRTGRMIEYTGNFVTIQNYDSVYMLPVLSNANADISIYATINANTSVAFYGENKNLLRYINGNNCADYGITAGLEPKMHNVPAPAGVRYISYSVFTAYGAKILEYPVVSKINANTYTKEIMDSVGLVTPKFSDARRMKTLVIGDSISADYYGNYKKWVTNLIDTDFFSYGMVTNDSIHATGFVARLSETEDDSFLARIKAIPNPSEYDLVIVFGGINDSIQGIPFGADGDTDTAAYFKPAVNAFFSYLTENFINARIAVLLPLRTSGYPYSANVDHKQYEYGEYIATVAKEYALPVLDLTNSSGFRPHIQSYSDRWTLIPDGYTDADGVHPNEEYCRDYLAPMIRDFLNSIL